MGVSKPWGDNLSNAALRASVSTVGVTAATAGLGAAVSKGGVSMRKLPIIAGFAAAGVGAPVFGSSITANATNHPHVLFDTVTGAGFGAAGGAILGTVLGRGKGKVGMGIGAAVGALGGAMVGTPVSYLNHVFLN